MLDSEFLDQIEEIFAGCSHPDVQKAVFSATLPANAEKVAFDVLRDPIRVVVGLKYDLRSSIIQARSCSLSSIGIRLCRRLLNR